MPRFQPKDLAWRATCLTALLRGATLEAAAAEAGVSSRTVIRHRDAEPGFAAAVDRALREGREAAGLPARRSWRESAAARERVLAGLRSGKDFRTAVEDAGVPLRTARTWRRRLPEWDRRVVADAAAGGTVLSVTVRDCPGRHCGTATGYDFGCFEEECRAAKWRQAAKARGGRG